MVWNVEGVHTKEELQKLVEKEQRREWDIHEAPIWRWIVVEDYTKESSWIILSINHCITDGINVAAYLKLVCDDSDPSSIRVPKGAKEAPMVVKMMIGLAYAVKIGIYLLSRP